MKVECYVCGRVRNHQTKDELIEEGWSGTDGTINGKKIKAEVCPDHVSALPLIILAFSGKNPLSLQKSIKFGKQMKVTDFINMLRKFEKLEEMR